MQGETELIIDALRKASRFLYRDFFELSALQSTGKSNKLFVSKSCNKVAENLQISLSKYYKKIIFEKREALAVNENASLDVNKIALVELLDGVENLERSIPFFAIMVTILVKKHSDFIAEKAVINFPVLNEIYYSEKGKGTWAQLQSSQFAGAIRTRVSGTNNKDNIIVSINDMATLQEAKTISDNMRNFGSYLYSVANFVSGKTDLLVCHQNPLTNKGIELFVRESGGIVSETNANFLLATNIHLKSLI